MVGESQCSEMEQKVVYFTNQGEVVSESHAVSPLCVDSSCERVGAAEMRYERSTGDWGSADRCTFVSQIRCECVERGSATFLPRLSKCSFHLTNGCLCTVSEVFRTLARPEIISVMFVSVCRPCLPPPHRVKIPRSCFAFLGRSLGSGGQPSLPVHPAPLVALPSTPPVPNLLAF